MARSYSDGPHQRLESWGHVGAKLIGKGGEGAYTVLACLITHSEAIKMLACSLTLLEVFVDTSVGEEKLPQAGEPFVGRRKTSRGGLCHQGDN